MISEQPRRSRFSATLSSRELEILRMITDGHLSREIADHLFISKRTVDYHLARVFLKLEVNNRIQAIRAARTLGLLPFEPTENAGPVEKRIPHAMDHRSRITD